MEKEITPKYTFTEVEGSEELSPVQRLISKTMEVTENFTMFDALSYVAKMEKAKVDKNAEIDGLNEMISAYEKEIKIIEDQLGVSELETRFQKEVIANIVQEPVEEVSAEPVKE